MHKKTRTRTTKKTSKTVAKKAAPKAARRPPRLSRAGMARAAAEASALAANTVIREANGPRASALREEPPASLVFVVGPDLWAQMRRAHLAMTQRLGGRVTLATFLRAMVQRGTDDYLARATGVDLPASSPTLPADGVS